MIDIRFDPKTFTLMMDGHADSVESGADLVCCSASTLFYTLAQNLYEYHNGLEKPVRFKDNSGHGRISCQPKKEYRKTITVIYSTILNGFDALAKQYPENISFRILTEG